MDGFRKSPRLALPMVAIAGLAALVLGAGPAFIATARAQTATNPPARSAATDPGVSSNPAAPAGADVQPQAPAQPAASADLQPAGDASVAADTSPSQAVDQSPRPGPPPGPRGPMNVQGPARGPGGASPGGPTAGTAPVRPVAVQGPARGPRGGAYPGRPTGRRAGGYRYGQGGGQAARPAQAPRLPNSGTGGLLDASTTGSPMTPWTPLALFLVGGVLGGAGILTAKRRMS
jgi:translation initiation factor IF-2